MGWQWTLLFLGYAIIGCGRSDHSSNVAAARDPQAAENEIANARRVIESAMEPWPISRDAKSEEAFMKNLSTFKRTCRIDISIELRSDAPNRPNLSYVSVDFRGRTKIQPPDDVSHLGLKSESALMIPYPFDAYYHRRPNGIDYSRVARIQNSVHTLITKIMRETSVCGQRTSK